MNEVVNFVKRLVMIMIYGIGLDSEEDACIIIQSVMSLP